MAGVTMVEGWWVSLPVGEAGDSSESGNESERACAHNVQAVVNQTSRIHTSKMARGGGTGCLEGARVHNT